MDISFGETLKCRCHIFLGSVAEYLLVLGGHYVRHQCGDNELKLRRLEDAQRDSPSGSVADALDTKRTE
jgi:hypothetical protein